MADRFPKDCWNKQCPHFHTRDLSIDDLVCSCDLLKIECDACDEDFCLYLCPLPKVKRGEWVKPECETLYRLYSGNKCSECGFVYCGDKTPYCPNCGARMDGGTK